VCGYSAICAGQEWRYWPQGYLGATWGHQEGRGGLFADRQGSFRAKNTPFRAFYRVFRKIGLENRLLKKKQYRILFFHATSPPINVLYFLSLTKFLARFPLEWAKPRKIDIFGGFLVFSTPISTIFFFFWLRTGLVLQFCTRKTTKKKIVHLKISLFGSTFSSFNLA
jgi:hypothetical protein